MRFPPRQPAPLRQSGRLRARRFSPKGENSSRMAQPPHHAPNPHKQTPTAWTTNVWKLLTSST
eukprot:2215064-Pyramimonas_sp.AAC.1